MTGQGCHYISCRRTKTAGNSPKNSRTYHSRVHPSSLALSSHEQRCLESHHPGILWPSLSPSCRFVAVEREPRVSIDPIDPFPAGRCRPVLCHCLLFIPPSFPPSLPPLRVLSPRHGTISDRLDRESDMAALLEATRPALKDVLGKVYSMSRDQVRLDRGSWFCHKQCINLTAPS